MELKKTFEGFLNVLNVRNMSHGNGSSAFVFQVTGILKPVTVSTDKGLQLSHSHMGGCNSLYGSNFDFQEGPEGPLQPSAGARRRGAVAPRTSSIR